MKKLVQVALAIVILGLIYVIYQQIATPIRFEKETNQRKALVIDRIKDIRTAERAFKTKYQHFTGDFDSLINFVLNEELELERKIVDEDDSVGLAQLKKAGKKNVETFTIAVIDTIFAPKTLTPDQVKELRYVPFTERKVQYILQAGQLTTGSGVVVPVVECRIPYKAFLDTVEYRQEIINMIDNEVNNFNRYAGVKFGSMENANNEAGNWED
ncbi:hypothetical protein [uncultured Alistipes sp.]|uniref:hypothetical protein n=1 Tax=uncultured Alistipes sp. TaxID=538949 RepID=UPI0032B27154